MKKKSFLSLFLALLTLVLTGAATAAMVVEQPAGTPLTSGSASTNFGAVPVGKTASREYTIRNSGDATVQLEGVQIQNSVYPGFVVDTTGMGTSLEPGASTTFRVIFTPTGVTFFVASLRVDTDGPDFTSLVEGQGTAPILVVERPAGHPLPIIPIVTDFAGCNVGSAAPQATYVLRNNGDVPLPITSVAISGANPGDFILDTTATAATIAPGGTTTFSVTFQPTVEGVRNATITVTPDGLTPFVTGVSGTGTVSQIEIESSTGEIFLNGNSFIHFGTLQVGGQGVTKTFTVRNTGTGPLAITGGDAPANFTLDLSAVPPVIAPGGEATFTVSWAATAVPPETGTLTLTSDAGNHPSFAIQLLGFGAETLLSVRQPSNTPLPSGTAFTDFGSVGVGSTASRTFRLRNVGSIAIQITGFSIEGEEADLFQATLGGLPLTIAANSSVNFPIVFAPDGPGSVQATYTITHTSGPDFTGTLGGTGLAPSLVLEQPEGTILTPGVTVTDFGLGIVGEGGETATYIIRNAGTAPLEISNTSAVTGPFVLEIVGGPSAIAPGESAVMYVSAAPDSGGLQTGELTLVSNASNFPIATIGLTGTAHHRPVFEGHFVSSSYQAAVIIREDILLAAASDEDGDEISLKSVMETSNAGGAVRLVGAGVRYKPPTGFFGQDEIQIEIVDSRGAVNSGYITVEVAEPPHNGAEPPHDGELSRVRLLSSEVRLRLPGVAGETYSLQRSLDGMQSWETLLEEVTADSEGLVIHTDSHPGTSNAFYRLYQEDEAPAEP